MVTRARERSPQEAYRLKQQGRIEGSPFMARRFPRLKALKVTLSYYDGGGTTKNGEMKCVLNVEHARSVLWFACRSGDCAGGVVDLSAALAKAVAGGCKVARGESRCPGARQRGEREEVPCQTFLRYKLNLDYD